MNAPNVIETAERHFVRGIGALVQGVIQHRKLDEIKGLDTESFVSGYRGSPLGNLDMEFHRQQSLLDRHKVRFREGLNEDLAATACWGTQQVPLLPNPRVRGVSAFWYGKSPGVDRSMDAVKHANLAGTSPQGGVVMLFGDDHGAKSSSTAHQSEYALISAGVPILNPSCIQEYVDLMPLAVELSRHAGLWVGLKCLTETVESSAVVALKNHPAESLVCASDLPVDADYHIKLDFAPLDEERSLWEFRLPAAQRFALANGLDRVSRDARRRSLGIIAPGKARVEVMEAFRILGLDVPRLRELGIRFYQPVLTWPLVEDTALEFCRSHVEILVVEEKRGLVEEQLYRVLQRLPAGERPELLGKRDRQGRCLVPEYGELNARLVARVIEGCLDRLLPGRWRLPEPAAEGGFKAPAAARQTQAPAPAARLPMYCSGCPHNRSTRHPEGTIAFGGIGCHGMALWIPELETFGTTHMGAEGANWIGIESFIDDGHIFQNMGDGTYSHSGSLAIRAAIANGSNLTYKILFNSATAMTGGQPVEGQLSAADYARQLLAEGCTRVALVSEAPQRHRSELAEGIELYPRDRLDEVQETFRGLRGVTAIVYDQGCAAERRRLRKRGKVADPAVRTLIHPEVCEGCGDCNLKSSCVSLLPLETPLGRKRVVDQDSCNKDYTCVEGFCPSFVTVSGGALKDRLAELNTGDLERQLPAAEPGPVTEACNLLIAGIGGSGVVSLGRMLAGAAHREGRSVQTFDVTGLAQKNGPVLSHVRIGPENGLADRSPRIPDGQLDLLLGCDIVSAAAEPTLRLLDPARSRAVVSAVLTPTAAFQRDPDLALGPDPFIGALAGAMDAQRLTCVNSGAEARRLLGSDTLMNIYVLGHAFQQGLIPVGGQALLEALSGRGEKSRKAFQLGRIAAHAPEEIGSLLGASRDGVPLEERPFEEILAYCLPILAEYQDGRYAESYAAFLDGVRAADPDGRLTRVVAARLFKLMRYKDEYEVARLFAAPGFRDLVAENFEGDYRLEFNLAPPLLSVLKDANGMPRKLRFGPWTIALFRLLAPLKRLRGTPLDPFGHTRDRRLDRKLLADYRREILGLLPRIDADNYATIVEIADLPDLVRGYGHVRRRSAAEAGERRAGLLRQLADWPSSR